MENKRLSDLFKEKAFLHSGKLNRLKLGEGGMS
jgi:hypothetical protein